ncbi:MAG: hypothetical protein ABJF11_08255 [Reichenbachiella sp.]|uniref:arsenate-mycothiol transferase ArsC n=1 Tax=Reichenbachiella sp. TaxID=2184521 RepID=UPI0032643366
MMKKTLNLIILCIAIIIGCSPKTSTEESTKTVLFVCTHGAARSPIAAAYFNQLAQEEGLNYQAVFRGTEPDAELTTATIEGLSADGFNINDWNPQLVNENDLKAASQIITFDCQPPPVEGLKIVAVEWNGTPSISKDYNTARDAILLEVRKLIVQLKSESN